MKGWAGFFGILALMVVILLLKNLAKSSHFEVEAWLRKSVLGAGFNSLSIVEKSILELFLLSEMILEKYALLAV